MRERRTCSQCNSLNRLRAGALREDRYLASMGGQTLPSIILCLCMCMPEIFEIWSTILKCGEGSPENYMYGSCLTSWQCLLVYLSASHALQHLGAPCGSSGWAATSRTMAVLPISRSTSVHTWTFAPWSGTMRVTSLKDQ